MSSRIVPAAAAKAPRTPPSPWLLVIVPLAIALPLLPFFFEVSHFVQPMFMQTTTYAIAVLGMVVVLLEPGAKLGRRGEEYRIHRSLRDMYTQKQTSLGEHGVRPHTVVQ